MPSFFQSRRALALLLVLVALCTWVGIQATSKLALRSTGDDPASRATPQAPDFTGDVQSTESGPPGPRPAAGPEESEFRRYLAAFKTIVTEEEAAQLLRELRSYLFGLAPSEAATVVSDFIAGGEDVALPLKFKIGINGFLEATPTLRVGMLDLLGEIDPEAAAQLGKEILVTPTTADEWAVSLRNVARREESDAANQFLREKTEDLIRNEEWQRKPSIGYLNAFDVLVHTRAVESTPLLSELIQRKDRRDLAHAGFLTLSRLTQREPVAVLHRLQQDRALQKSRPEMVAQQFARADLREVNQRELVRMWMLDPARTPSELDSFARIFPNNNQMISRNLLTREKPLAGEELLAHDREAFAVVVKWQETPEFEAVRPHLATMAQRLATFIRQAAP